MSTRLVALKDVLGALEQAGPLSSDALASRLRLNRLDARLVLVDAHAHGLVRTDTRGDWAITDLGREALTTDITDDRRAAARDEGWWNLAPYLERLRTFGAGARWRAVLHPRYLARRGLPLAVGTIVCAGGVAVASSRLEGSAGPPVVPTTNANSTAHGRHTHTRGTRHLARSGAIGLRRHRPSTLASTTGRTRHLRGHLIRQSARAGVSLCQQRHGGSTTAVTGSCTAGRRGGLRSTAGGSGTSSTQRAPQNTGSGGSSGGVAVSPKAGS